MTPNGILQIVLFCVLILLLTKPLGTYMARVFQGERTWLDPVFKPVERLCYKLIGTKEDEDMKWTTYAFALLMFSVVGALFTYALLRLQGHLPFNPKGFSGKEMTPDLSFNTANSFTTNTNWQNYTPESTISYFSNMVSLAIHNWMSAAAGIAVAIALVRGFARRSANGLGNFWVDITRCTLYILLPICLVYSLFLVQQGVPQNLNAYTDVKTLEGASQSVPQGFVASQESIKMLGTNGGGLFNANSAHPYENPTPLSNFIQILSIFAIGAGLTYTFGKMVGNVRQGWALFGAMAFMFLGGLSLCYWSEAKGNPNVAQLGVMTQASITQPGGNMEGKETRFGIANSALFATVTTDASCGAVNSMHDSYTALGGMVPLLNIMCDEVIFGGVGAGLFGMLMYDVVLWTALGDNINFPPGANSQTFTDAQKADEDKLVKVHPAAFWNHVNNSSPSNYYGATWNNVNNSGAHGFSEILYQYASQTGNNGSAFAGLTGNTPYFNATGGIAMLVGRFLMIIPLLAMAGSLAKKKAVPASAGTLATDTSLFAFLLAFVVLIVGALEYFPALSLGPIVEHFQMIAGKLF